ncbi:hypothetical protein PHMEG_00035667, partial [Phytophthora megakarya]
MWHGPFRIDEIRDDFRVKLKVKGIVLTLGYTSADSSREWSSQKDQQLSWEPDSSNDVFEVESIRDVRWVKHTLTARRSREYLVKLKGYDDPEWIPVTQLNCGSLLYEFNKGTRARARFQAIQAGDDHPTV